MNTPSQTTASNVASQVVSNARCVLEYALITNNSANDRWYVVVDSATVPTLYASGSLPAGLRSGRVGAGQQWRVFPVDAAKGEPFTSGVVVLSFASNADGSPNYSALSAADMNVTAWSAALQ